MMQDRPVVYLVDDDASASDACRFLLEGYGYGVASWADGESFLAAADLHAEAALILDMRMPGLEGPQVHARLREAGSTLGVIVLTAHGDVDLAVEEMKRGAVDFLQKPVRGGRLREAVELALARSRELAARHALEQRALSLSEREREVAELLSHGFSNRQIAERLCLAVRTVEVHRAGAIRKLGAESSADLARLWQQLKSAR